MIQRVKDGERIQFVRDCVIMTICMVNCTYIMNKDFTTLKTKNEKFIEEFLKDVEELIEIKF